MPLPKPIVPRWCDVGTRTEPTEGRKDTGWLTSDYPPAQELNWIDGYQSDWMKYLSERVADGLSTPPEREFVLKNPFTTVAQLRTLETQGVGIDIGLNVGFYAASADTDAVHVSDATFGLRGADANLKKLVFDGDADSFRLSRSAHRFEWLANSVQRAALSPIGFRIGAGAPTLPFHITQDIGGSLGTGLGDYVDIASIDYLNEDTSSILAYGYRHSAGSDWTAGSTYLHNVQAGDPNGFVRFSGSSVSNPTYGIGTHVGIGVGVRGADAALWVDNASVYAHAVLPRSLDSTLGSSARKWRELIVGGPTSGGSGVGEIKSVSSAGAVPVLFVRAYEDSLERARLEFVGISPLPYLSLLASPGVELRLPGCVAQVGNPTSRKGYGFFSSGGIYDGTGLFYSSDNVSLQCWRQSLKVVDITGRVGTPSDVQLTLGRGFGVGATIADLREYACVCQDYLAQDATGGPIVQGDLVMVTSAADHAVTRTAALGQTGAIGVSVDVSTANGSIARIATSGIVLARAAAGIVTRGDYVRASATAGRVQTQAAFDNTVVGVALQTSVSNGYFKMLIRFGG